MQYAAKCGILIAAKYREGVIAVNKPKLLIAEGAEDVRLALADLLRGAFQVKVCADGKETNLIHLYDKEFYYNEIVYFIDCIQNDKPVEQCPPEQSADAIRIVLAEIESADRQGERIVL